MMIQLMQNITQLAVNMPELLAQVKSANALMSKNDEQLLNKVINLAGLSELVNKKGFLRLFRENILSICQISSM